MTHTNTKRIAAISLVAVLCLSSFAMLAPAASASLQATGAAWLGNGTESDGWIYSTMTPSWTT